MARRMNPMDAVFVHLESRDCPQQTAGLFTFRLPPQAPPLFLRTLWQRMRSFPVTAAPFNQVLVRDALVDRVLPAWEILPPQEIDIDYHFRHSALPAPGGEVELGVLISRLYSIPLDLARPLWEVHLIEGLENHRFGLFLKMHHALMDGMAGMKLILSWLSESGENLDQPPIWSVPRNPRPRTPRQRATVHPGQAVKQITAALAAHWAALRGRRPDLTPPYAAPRSILNGRITARRRISTQRVPMARLGALAKQHGATLNDVALAIIGAALRRYLQELEQLPAATLTAGVLVSTKSNDADHVSGNAISFLFAPLATHHDAPLQRLQAISAATRGAKRQLQALSFVAINAYTGLFMAPYVTSQLLQRGHRIRPMHSLSVSNLHGPRGQTYFSGAALEAFYPATVIAHGQALMVALMSCHDQMCFSFVACPDTVPHSQRLAVYLVDALEELERASND